LTAAVVGLTVAVALLAVLVAGLLRSNAELTRALHNLGVDLSPAGRMADHGSVPSPVALGVRPTPGRPDSTDVIDLAGSTPRGDAVKLAVTAVPHDTLIAFLTSGCHTCMAFWEVFRQRPPEVPGGARLVVVTRGGDAESPGTVAELAGDRLPVVMSTDVWEHYDVPYAPYFVYVSGPAGRVVGEGVAAGWEEVRTLVANAIADGTTSPTPPPDTSAGQTRKSKADLEREAQVDRELRAVGILPGDPRLHPTTISDSGRRDR
jgi:hypothetical protein